MRRVVGGKSAANFRVNQTIQVEILRSNSAYEVAHYLFSSPQIFSFLVGTCWPSLMGRLNRAVTWLRSFAARFVYLSASHFCSVKNGTLQFWNSILLYIGLYVAKLVFSLRLVPLPLVTNWRRKSVRR